MRERPGDIFALHASTDAICLTTNGSVTHSGHAVMGRGVALQATYKYPKIRIVLGGLLRAKGNHVFVLYNMAAGAPAIVSFPVKHTWTHRADVNLIIRSAAELVLLTDAMAWQEVVLPRPGCGNGGLDWERDVKHRLEAILDSRFLIVDRAAAVAPSAQGKR